MKYTLKLTRRQVHAVIEDLSRPHPFAGERVGFLACRFMESVAKGLLVLGHGYHAVADEDYIDDQNYGALVSGKAFQMAMQVAYTQQVGIFHIHLHSHRGTPKPSPTDLRETKKFIPDFFHVQPHAPHGAIILSLDSLSARVWSPTTKQPIRFAAIEMVGAPLSNTANGVSK
jgi:hypothetical protein